MDMCNRPHPRGVIERSGTNDDNLGPRHSLAISPAATIAAEPIGTFKAARADPAKGFWGTPVTLKLSALTGIDRLNALPDQRWHSVQWQA
jgi:hypothetical protein